MADILRDATILNVGKDAAGRVALTRVLRRVGARVLECASGEGALKVAARRPVEVILLDVERPELEGIEVARRLRADPATADIPILQHSSSAVDDASIARGLESGADGYLAEPVGADVLRATVRALLRAHRARQEVARQAQFLDTILESVPQSIGYLDRQLRFVRANSAFARAVALSPGKLPGLSFPEVMPDAPDLAEALRRVIETGEPSASRELARLPYRRPEAGVHYYDIDYTPVKNARGEVEGLVMAVVDITDQVNQRESLVATERARAELAETLNAEVNHRVKNNLMMATSLLQLEAAEQDDPRVVAALQEARSRLATFADVQEQLQASAQGRADLLEVLRRIAKATRTVFGAERVEFSVEGGPVELPSGAATHLAVVANELITNATKHGAPRPDGMCRVEVEVRQEDNVLRLSVWNSGPPVPADFDVAREAHLGLRLVRDLVVDQYHGTFSLRPREGGTVAEVAVPRAALADAPLPPSC